MFANQDLFWNNILNHKKGYCETTGKKKYYRGLIFRDFKETFLSDTLLSCNLTINAAHAMEAFK